MPRENTLPQQEPHEVAETSWLRWCLLAFAVAFGGRPSVSKRLRPVCTLFAHQTPRTFERIFSYILTSLERKRTLIEIISLVHLSVVPNKHHSVRPLMSFLCPASAASRSIRSVQCEVLSSSITIYWTLSPPQLISSSQ